METTTNQSGLAFTIMKSLTRKENGDGFFNALYPKG